MLIAGGAVVLAGARSSGPRPRKARVRAGLRLRAGDLIEVDITAPAPAAGPAGLRPEAIPLTIVYEDDDMLVIDKPAGMTVHPGAGRSSGTLAHAVLAHAPELAGIGGADRPGIVHRLDKDTSGLLVVAKTDVALRDLVEQIQSRRARRDYLALVHGRVQRASGTVDAPIGRDPRRRTRMAVVATGRRAVTHYRVAESFDDATLLEVSLNTGRTHQIRVHCAHLGHPVVGDPTYGRRSNPWGLRRQALHAMRLAFAHPRSGRAMAFSVPLPGDIEAALQALRAGAERRAQRTGAGRTTA